MSKIWFITGSSRGLGRAFAEVILAAGHRVVATARDPGRLSDLAAAHGDRFRAVRLDVDSPEESSQAVAAALDAFGRIDVLVNNAGFGFIGAFEEMTPEDFRRQIDTNFWGTVNVTRAALPHLRRQGAGHIFQVTSIGGRFSSAGLSGYHAAKFAVEGFSEALAKEIRPLGLKLTIVEPGGFRTDWAGASMAFAEPIEAYDATVGQMRTMLANFTGHEQGDPRKAAEVLLQAAEMAEPPLRLPLGGDAMLFLRNSYEQSLAELERWSAFTRSTDYPGAILSEEVKSLA
ncbi:oxidoreductase [Termitidicoccus mucosus]|uniref:Oxidoreductase n=1 Tax=Termitidicoccus mucosus TaxID=1184151 RepID=A0A178IQA4_9BACT|nr:oxidoreductase [Opitutaceae bacterium TSB47]